VSDKIMAAGFDHPCRETCSGWAQGRERGLFEAKQDIERAYFLRNTDSLAHEKNYHDKIETLTAEIAKLREALEFVTAECETHIGMLEEKGVRVALTWTHKANELLARDKGEGD